jgi:molybdopterin-synthase adenylyltransferase
MDRYFRNIGAISAEEQQKLKQCSVCIVGLGGLGGYILEFAARLGIGSVTGIDFDRFETSNLNRQLLSTPGNIGSEKAAAAAQRVKLVNDEVRFTACTEKLTDKNAGKLLKGHHLVFDALDSAGDRLILAGACSALKLPLVHGAINDWSGQAAVIYPGDETLKQLYAQGHSTQAPASLSFTPAAVAALQVSLAVRVILGREVPPPGMLYLLDLLTFELTQLKL